MKNLFNWLSKYPKHQFTVGDAISKQLDWEHVLLTDVLSGYTLNHAGRITERMATVGGIAAGALLLAGSATAAAAPLAVTVGAIVLTSKVAGTLAGLFANAAAIKLNTPPGREIYARSWAREIFAPTIGD